MRRNQNSAKIASHSSTATGRASTSPRAKLPFPRRADSALSRNENLWGHFIGCADVNITYWLPPLRHRVPKWKWFPCRVNARPARVIAEHYAVKVLRTADRAWLSLGSRQRCRQDRRPPIFGHVHLQACLGVLLCSAPAHSLHAQDVDIGSPQSLVEQAEPIGIGAGPVRIFPRLTGDVRYDSNIYNRSIPQIEDVAFVLRPSVSIQPELSRHELRLDLAGEARRYLDTPAENSEQFLAVLWGRAYLAERTRAEARVHVARRIERRGSVGDEFLTDRPVSYLETEAAVGLGRSGGRLELSGELAVSETTYSDARLEGAPVDQSFRDTTRLRGVIRTGYRLGARITPFVQVFANDLRYELEASRPRGSSGFAVLSGLRLDLGDLAEAEAAVGYLQQNFEDPLDEDFSGIDFRLAARWTPVPRFRLAMEGGRSIERSPLPDAPAVVETSVRASATYALGSRMLAGLELGAERAAYSGIARSERRHAAEASLQYQINQSFAAFAAAGYRHQDGRGTGARSYSGTTFRLGLRMTP